MTTAPAPRFTAGGPLPAVLVLRDLEELLGLGHSQVWTLYQRGEFARFELTPRIGNRPRFSGARLQAWLDGVEEPPAVDDTPRRFFASARRRGRA